ncbi:MAG: chromosome partitioning protein ParB, partial [Alphaproteobacteria bacterium]
QSRAGKNRGPDKNSRNENKDIDIQALEQDLAGILGLKVTIRFKGRGGDLTIYYESLEQLDDVLQRLNRPIIAMKSGTGGSVFLEE